MGPIEQVSPAELSVDLTAESHRPRIRVEGARTEEELLFRLVSDEDVLLWVSIDDWWEDYVFVRPKQDRWISPLQPIRAAEVRGGGNWLWRFARSMLSSPRNPFYAARFRFRETVCRHDGLELRNRALRAAIAPNGPAAPHLEQYTETRGRFWNEHDPSAMRVLPGAVTGLRRLTGSDRGRLQWWRKVARAGELPPILVWYVRVLDKNVVLDGHVRLEAALQENVEVTAIQVWHERRTRRKGTSERQALERGLEQLLIQKPDATARANELLREAYDGRSIATQRGWPIPGGTSTWASGVLENLPDIATLPDWVPEWIRRCHSGERRSPAITG